MVITTSTHQYEQENRRIEEAMRAFDYKKYGYCLDTTPGRIGYLYHNPEWFWKLVGPMWKLWFLCFHLWQVILY